MTPTPPSPFLSLLAAASLASCTHSNQQVRKFNPHSTPDTTAADVVKTSLSQSPDPSLLSPDPSPFRLGPGDVIDIELLNSGDGPQSTFVGPDGRIYFHLLNGQQVWGLTIAETTLLLQHGLSRFIQSPQVSITLREVHSRRIWLLGRISSPGLYELAHPMTVLEAISKAGGLFTSSASGTTKELADLQHSFLIRKGQLLPVNFSNLLHQGDASQNIYLQHEDFIYFPSALGSEVYVMGAVSQPRSVPFNEELTLLSAIAECRGLLKGAKPQKVAIVRGSLRDPEIAIVDAQSIITGKSPDVLLKPKDLVFIPQSSPASLAAYAELVVSTFARTVAANEGARAAGSESPVGLNLGITP